MFLSSPDPNAQAEFDRHLRQRQTERTALQSTSAVLLCESDPVAFLAGFWAAVTAGVPVFLGNPQWRREEWTQVGQPVKFQAIWGDAPLHVGDRPSPVPRGLIAIPTGGTSGRIRFACHTWDRLAASARGFQQHVGDDRLNACCTLPLFHVSGLMQFVRSRVSDGHLHLHPYKAIEAGQLPDFDPSDFWISLVPTQLQRLLDRPAVVPWLRRFRGILLGGAPAWDRLLDRARSQHLPLALTYGSTETASQIATLLPDEFRAGKRSSGRVLPHASIRICDESRRDVEAGKTGRLVVAGKSLMSGYYPGDRPLSPLDALQTDDLGYFDTSGFLHILGRVSETTITGGEKVVPAEVEAALRRSPLLQDVAVLGVPDAEWGEVVVAAIVLEMGVSDAAAVPAALKAAIADRLAPYKHPKHWLVTDALPRNDRGKLQRDRLREWVQSQLSSRSPR